MRSRLGGVEVGPKEGATRVRSMPVGADVDRTTGRSGGPICVRSMPVAAGAKARATASSGGAMRVRSTGSEVVAVARRAASSGDAGGGAARGCRSSTEASKFGVGGTHSRTGFPVAAPRGEATCPASRARASAACPVRGGWGFAGGRDAPRASATGRVEAVAFAHGSGLSPSSAVSQRASPAFDGTIPCAAANRSRSACSSAAVEWRSVRSRDSARSTMRSSSGG